MWSTLDVPLVKPKRCCCPTSLARMKQTLLIPFTSSNTTSTQHKSFHFPKELFQIKIRQKLTEVQIHFTHPVSHSDSGMKTNIILMLETYIKYLLCIRQSEKNGQNTWNKHVVIYFNCFFIKNRSVYHFHNFQQIRGYVSSHFVAKGDLKMIPFF